MESPQKYLFPNVLTDISYIGPRPPHDLSAPDYRWFSKLQSSVFLVEKNVAF